MQLYPSLWNKIESEATEDQALALGLSLSLTKLLLSRVGSLEAARDFLSPQLFAQPMQGEIAAAERIAQAIQGSERIGILGDYDVDGVTSAALLTHFFKAQGLSPEVFIPSRYVEGYGLNPKSIGLIPELDLLITVDCGITSVEEVEQLKARGIDVIITDHHEPGERLPQAIVMNPKLADYGFAHLAGVGVAYKLVLRLEQLGFPLPEGLIELAALGTVADVMPLIGENRYIVQAGLQAMTQSALPGLRQLIRALHLTRELRASDIAFRIGPLLNAAGRMDSAWPAYQLLVENDPDAIEVIIRDLMQANQARRAATDAILKDLDRQVDSEAAMIVEQHTDWLPGILGLAASKAVERYRRPVILLEAGESLKGSGRSIGQFSLLASLQANQEWLQRFGGHQQAAGLELSFENYASFKAGMEQYTQAVLRPEDRIPRFDYHPIEVSELDFRLLDQLDQLEPFGMGNPAPIFRLDGLELQRIRLMGRNNQAAALEFIGGARNLRVVTFSVVEHDWQPGVKYDLLFRLERNTFQGVSQLQLLLSDYRRSQFVLTPKSPSFLSEVERIWQLVLSYDSSQPQVGEIDLWRAYQQAQAPAQQLGRLSDSVFADVTELVQHLPTRPDLVNSYKALKAKPGGVALEKEPDPLRMLLQLKLFESLGLLKYTKDKFHIRLQWQDPEEKVDLFRANFYKQSQAILEDYHELAKHHSGD